MGTRWLLKLGDLAPILIVEDHIVPHAIVTRIQSPDALIHPEHKVEYRPSELTGMLEQTGFAIQKAGGICPMPVAVRTGVFDDMELIHNARLSDNPDGCYAFYVQAAKR